MRARRRRSRRLRGATGLLVRFCAANAPRRHGDTDEQFFEVASARLEVCCGLGRLYAPSRRWFGDDDPEHSAQRVRAHDV